MRERAWTQRAGAPCCSTNATWRGSWRVPQPKRLRWPSPPPGGDVYVEKYGGTGPNIAAVRWSDSRRPLPPGVPRDSYPAACGKSRRRASSAPWAAVVRTMVISVIMMTMLVVMMTTTTMTTAMRRRRRRTRVNPGCINNAAMHPPVRCPLPISPYEHFPSQLDAHPCTAGAPMGLAFVTELRFAKKPPSIIVKLTRLFISGVMCGVI